MKKLFTERHGGAVPRVKEDLDEITRNGLLDEADRNADQSPAHN